MRKLDLPVKPASALDDYTRRLETVFKSDLVSVVLYGSAVSGEFAARYSNINVMVVLNDTSLASLSKARPLVNSAKYAMISAVFFTEDYIRASLDVFPVEFLDIIENHTLLYGRDVLCGLKVDQRNLRFQCEQELKSKLIAFKKRYLAARNRRDFEDLLFSSFTSTLHIMRNLLRIKGYEPPYPKESVLAAFEKAFGMDTTVLSKILWAKSKSMPLTTRDVDALLIGFVKALEIMSSAADKL